jgi:hypothetical protein
MHRDARYQTFRFHFDISASTDVPPTFIHEPFNDIKIEAIRVFYLVATDGGTRPESIDIGIQGSLTKYASITPAASTAVDTTTVVTPSSTDLVKKGSQTLRVTRSATTGGTNTGEVIIIMKYSLVDSTTR